MNKCIDCGKQLSKQSSSRKAYRCKSCSKKGKNNPRYTDGKRTADRYCIDCGSKIPSRSGKPNGRCIACVDKGKSKLSQWRSDIFTRDDFTCQECDAREYKLEAHHKIEVHHKKTFSKILEENDIKSLEQALLCEELWNLNNGQTLCKQCHKKTDSYGRRDNVG